MCANLKNGIRSQMLTFPEMVICSKMEGLGLASMENAWV